MTIHSYRLVITSLSVLGASLILLLSACGFAAPSGLQSINKPILQPSPGAIEQQPVNREIYSPSYTQNSNPSVIDALRPAPVIIADPLPNPASTSADLSPDIPVPAEIPLTAQYSESQYYVSGFACTGSMRPALDCGDEGVFLKPPFPTPLAVGDIISFAPPAECRYYQNQIVSKAHRIISVRFEQGTPFFTTQGDTSPSPDPCEVTMDQIDGRLVEVNKGVRPQDIIDTSAYDGAKEAVEQLKAYYAEKKFGYDAQKEAYDALVAEYEILVAQAKTTQEEANETFQKVDAQVKALNELSQELNSLSEEINRAIGEVDRLYQTLFID